MEKKAVTKDITWKEAICQIIGKETKLSNTISYGPKVRIVLQENNLNNAWNFLRVSKGIMGSPVMLCHEKPTFLHSKIQLNNFIASRLISCKNYDRALWIFHSIITYCYKSQSNFNRKLCGSVCKPKEIKTFRFTIYGLSMPYMVVVFPRNGGIILQFVFPYALKSFFLVPLSLSLVLLSNQITSLSNNGCFMEVKELVPSFLVETFQALKRFENKEVDPLASWAIGSIFLALQAIGEISLAKRLFDEARTTAIDFYGRDHVITQRIMDEYDVVFHRNHYHEIVVCLTSQELKVLRYFTNSKIFEAYADCRGGYPKLFVENLQDILATISMDTINDYAAEDIIRNTLCACIYVVTMDTSTDPNDVIIPYIETNAWLFSPDDVHRHRLSDSVSSVVSLNFLLETAMILKAIKSMNFIRKSLLNALICLKNNESFATSLSLEIYKDLGGFLSSFVSMKDFYSSDQTTTVVTIVTCGRQGEDLDTVANTLPIKYTNVENKQSILVVSSRFAVLKDINELRLFHDDNVKQVKQVLKPTKWMVGNSSSDDTDYHSDEPYGSQAAPRFFEALLSWIEIKKKHEKALIDKNLVRTTSLTTERSSTKDSVQSPRVTEDRSRFVANIGQLKSEPFYKFEIERNDIEEFFCFVEDSQQSIYSYQRRLVFSLITAPALLSAAIHHQFHGKEFVKETFKVNNMVSISFVSHHHNALIITHKEKTLCLTYHGIMDNHVTEDDVILNDVNGIPNGVTLICDDIIKKCSEYLDVCALSDSDWCRSEAANGFDMVKEENPSLVEENVKLRNEISCLKAKIEELTELKKDGKLLDSRIEIPDEGSQHFEVIFHEQNSHDSSRNEDDLSICSQDNEQTRSLSLEYDIQYRQEQVPAQKKEDLLELGKAEFRRESAERKLHKFVDIQKDVMIFKRNKSLQDMNTVDITQTPLRSCSSMSTIQQTDDCKPYEKILAGQSFCSEEIAEGRSKGKKPLFFIPPSDPHASDDEENSSIIRNENTKEEKKFESQKESTVSFKDDDQENSLERDEASESECDVIQAQKTSKDKCDVLIASKKHCSLANSGETHLEKDEGKKSECDIMSAQKTSKGKCDNTTSSKKPSSGEYTKANPLQKDKRTNTECFIMSSQKASSESGMENKCSRSSLKNQFEKNHTKIDEVEESVCYQQHDTDEVDGGPLAVGFKYKFNKERKQSDFIHGYHGLSSPVSQIDDTEFIPNGVLLQLPMTGDANDAHNMFDVDPMTGDANDAQNMFDVDPSLQLCQKSKSHEEEHVSKIHDTSLLSFQKNISLEEENSIKMYPSDTEVHKEAVASKINDVDTCLQAFQKRQSLEPATKIHASNTNCQSFQTNHDKVEPLVKVRQRPFSCPGNLFKQENGSSQSGKGLEEEKPNVIENGEKQQKPIVRQRVKITKHTQSIIEDEQNLSRASEQQENTSPVLGFAEPFWESITSQEDTDHRVNVNCIIGNIASGKSSIFQSIVELLSETKVVMYSFSMTFSYLNLFGRKNMSLLKFLNSCVHPGIDLIDIQHFEKLIEHPTKILVVLDGFDEYRHRERIIDDNFEQRYPNDPRGEMPAAVIISKILRQKILYGAKVLVTSRPYEAKELRGIIAQEPLDIKGLYNKGIKELIFGSKSLAHDECAERVNLDIDNVSSKSLCKDGSFGSIDNESTTENINKSSKVLQSKRSSKLQGQDKICMQKQSKIEGENDFQHGETLHFTAESHQSMNEILEEKKPTSRTSLVEGKAASGKLQRTNKNSSEKVPVESSERCRPISNDSFFERHTRDVKVLQNKDSFLSMPSYFQQDRKNAGKLTPLAKFGESEQTLKPLKEANINSSVKDSHNDNESILSLKEQNTLFFSKTSNENGKMSKPLIQARLTDDVISRRTKGEAQEFKEYSVGSYVKEEKALESCEKHEEVLKHRETSIKVTQKHHEVIIEIEANLAVAKSFKNVRQYDQALSSLFKCEKLSKQVADERFELIVTFNICQVLQAQLRLDEAIGYGKRCLNLCYKLDDKVTNMNVSRVLGAIYQSFDKPYNALHYLHVVLEIAYQLADQEIQMMTSQDLANSFMVVKLYDKATHYYERSLILSKEIGNKDVEMSSYRGLASLYEKIGKPKDATHYYERSLILSKEIGNKDVEMSSYRGLASIYEKIGKPKDALSYKQKALEIEVCTKQFQNGSSNDKPSVDVTSLPLLKSGSEKTGSEANDEYYSSCKGDRMDCNDGGTQLNTSQSEAGITISQNVSTDNDDKEKSTSNVNVTEGIEPKKSDSYLDPSRENYDEGPQENEFDSSNCSKDKSDEVYDGVMRSLQHIAKNDKQLVEEKEIKSFSSNEQNRPLPGDHEKQSLEQVVENERAIDIEKESSLLSSTNQNLPLPDDHEMLAIEKDMQIDGENEISNEQNLSLSENNEVESLEEAFGRLEKVMGELPLKLNLLNMDQVIRSQAREFRRKKEEEEIAKLLQRKQHKKPHFIQPASLPVQIEDDNIVSCDHFKRGCDVLFPCCNVYYQCHRCHNQDKKCTRDDVKACDATHLRCRTCLTTQEITPTADHCNHCKRILSEYFCGICKHYTGVEKDPYHCEHCGICRTNKSNSFHCHVCDVCLNNRLKGRHKCRANSGHDECCICLEDAFNGCQVLPCSHKVHRECALAMIQNGVRTCPICRASIYE